MKKILLALVFCFVAPLAAHANCSVPYSFSNGTIADANQVNANFAAAANCNVTGFGNVLNILTFGAKCDGVTDDTAAMTAWAAAITTGITGIISGQCTTTTGFTIPLGDRISIIGYGDNSVFVYTGANTTASPFVFGTYDVMGAAGCSMKEFTVENVKFSSNTVMTGGTGVAYNSVCDGRINNVTYGGAFGGNSNWWNAVHYAGGNSVYSRGGTIQGQNDCLTINGDDNFAFTDPFFLHVKASKCANSGVRIAGKVGGLYFDDSDVLNNGTNVLIDQSQVASPNLQLFFGPLFASDITVGGAGIGIHVVDPGGPFTSLTYKGWLATATNQCFLIDAGAPTSGQPRYDFSGAKMGNCHAPVGSHGGDIENQNLNNLVSITGSTFFTSQAGKPTIFNAAGANPILFTGNVTNEANFNISGSYSGSFLRGTFFITDAQASSIQSVLLDGSGNANGAGIKMLGNGVTTPAKYLRSFNGDFQIVSDDYGTALMTLDDLGNLRAALQVQGESFKVGSIPGVSCSGSPTVSFASVNGIVTHC